MTKRNLLKNITLILFAVTAISCNNNRKVNAVEMNQSENKDSLIKTEETTILKIDLKRHDYEENRIADSTIINGIKGLSYVKNSWKKDTLYRFEEDNSIKTIRQVSDSALVVLTWNSDYKQFHFYEISIDGELKHDTILSGDYWDLVDINNFIAKIDNNTIYYKTDLQADLYCYNQKTKQHEQVLEADILNLNFKSLHRGYQDNG